MAIVFVEDYASIRANQPFSSEFPFDHDVTCDSPTLNRLRTLHRCLPGPMPVQQPVRNVQFASSEIDRRTVHPYDDVDLHAYSVSEER